MCDNKIFKLNHLRSSIDSNNEMILIIHYLWSIKHFRKSRRKWMLENVGTIFVVGYSRWIMTLFPCVGQLRRTSWHLQYWYNVELDSSHHKIGENVKNVKFYNQLSPNSTRPSPAQLRTQTELWNCKHFEHLNFNSLIFSWPQLSHEKRWGRARPILRSILYLYTRY